jgi:hypothetical protein
MSFEGLSLGEEKLEGVQRSYQGLLPVPKRISA